MHHVRIEDHKGHLARDSPMQNSFLSPLPAKGPPAILECLNSPSSGWPCIKVRSSSSGFHKGYSDYATCTLPPPQGPAVTLLSGSYQWVVWLSQLAGRRQWRKGCLFLTRDGSNQAKPLHSSALLIAVALSFSYYGLSVFVAKTFWFYVLGLLQNKLNLFYHDRPLGV